MSVERTATHTSDSPLMQALPSARTCRRGQSSCAATKIPRCELGSGTSSIVYALCSVNWLASPQGLRLERDPALVNQLDR
jgi:hypothetical protein